MSNSLEKIKPQEVEVVPNVASMLQAVIEKGVSNDNVAALEKLVGLYERMQDRDAEKSFAEAFMELQKELPKVQATKVIPDKNGNMRSSFAPFESIDSQLRPIAFRHGFTYSFAEGEFAQGRITKICTVQHVGGYKRSNPFSVRIGSGPPGCSESQADGAAHSYAKRGALCDAFNIIVHGIDNDARLEGGAVTRAQADELEQRAKMVNCDIKAFLKFAGAATFAEIPSKNYEVMDRFLAAKERKNA